VKTPNRYIKVQVLDDSNREVVFENTNSLGARIDFMVERLPTSHSGGMNIAQVQIYNLKDETFDFIASSGYVVNITVGYRDQNNLVFNGRVLSAFRRKEMADVITSLYCSTTFENDKDIVNMSIETMKLEDLLKKIAKDQKLDIQTDSFTHVIKDRSIFGSPVDVLNNLALRYNFTWWLDNGTLIIKENRLETPRFFFSPESSLLKPPIRTEAGVDIEIYLNPFINPSDVFELSSKFADYRLAGLEFVERVRGGGFTGRRVPKSDRYIGKYRVLTLTHEGSTHTNAWYTKIVGHYE
jgi:hypothetical protein